MPLHDVPLDIIYDILDRLPRSAQMSLSLASRDLYVCAMHSLYCDLVLVQSPVRAVKCLKTLLRNRLAADNVKGLTVKCHRLALPSYYRLLSDVLSRLPNLTSLTLYLLHPCDSDMSTSLPLYALDFPHLSQLELDAHFSDAADAFVQRHRASLQKLSFDGCWQCHMRSHALSQSMGPFPHLSIFSGTASYVPRIIPGSSAKELYITLEGVTDADVDEMFRALAQAHGSVRKIFCRAIGWSTRFLENVRTYTGAVESLIYHNCNYQGGPEHDAELTFIETLMTLLPHLPHLKSLSLLDNWAYRTLIPGVVHRYDEFDIVRNCEKACETLQTLVLPNRIKWERSSPPLRVLSEADTGRKAGGVITELRMTPNLHDLQSHAWFYNHARRGNAGALELVEYMRQRAIT